MSKPIESLGDLRVSYRLLRSGDRWGDCMAALFAVADEMHARNCGPPNSWKYNPGSNYAEREEHDIWGFDLLHSSEEELSDFGALLFRYRRMLVSAGADY